MSSGICFPALVNLTHMNVQTSVSGDWYYFNSKWKAREHKLFVFLHDKTGLYKPEWKHYTRQNKTYSCIAC